MSETEKKPYKAALIGVLFDEEYNFEDILLLGISTSPQQSFAIQQQEVMRLYEDFSENDGKKNPIEYSEARSNYDESICVIKYAGGYEHIYCLFTEGENDT